MSIIFRLIINGHFLIVDSRLLGQKLIVDGQKLIIDGLYYLIIK